MTKYVLQNQRGEQYGPEFSRYADAFNYRAATNRRGYRIVEK